MGRLKNIPLLVAGLGVAAVVHAYELYLWHAHKKSIYGRR